MVQSRIFTKKSPFQPNIETWFAVGLN